MPWIGDLMAKRSYTDADREAVRVALTMNGGNLRAASRSTGIPFSTVKTWHDKPEPEGIDALPAAVIEAASELIRADKRGEVIEAAWDLAVAGFKRSLEALPKASAQAAAIAAGIAIDKAQLLSGEATARQEVHSTVTYDADPDNIAAILNILSEAGVIPPAPAETGEPETLRLLSS